MSTYTPTDDEIAEALRLLTAFTDEYRATAQHVSSASVWTLNMIHQELGSEGEPTAAQIRRVRALIEAKLQWSLNFTIADR